MLVRIWIKGIFIVTMEICIATIENSTEILHKIFLNRPAIPPSNSTSGHLFEEIQTIIQKDIYTPMFITVLFTIAKIWKQLRLLRTINRQMTKEDEVHRYNGILLSIKKRMKSCHL